VQLRLRLAGANLDEAALAFTGIDPYHPFRFAVSEHDALTQLFASVRQELRHQCCSRCNMPRKPVPLAVASSICVSSAVKVLLTPRHPVRALR